MRAPAAALALLALVAAGCTTAPGDVRARAGDFVVVDLVALDGTGAEVLNHTRLRAVVADDVPPRLPPGWGNDTASLPRGVQRALEGLRPGASAATPLLAPEDAFGPWDPNRTISAPQRQRLSRVLDLPAPAPLEEGRLRWANASWGAEVLEETNATVRVRLAALPEVGTLLEFPDYWNDRYQLWRSRLAGGDAEAIEVEHLAEPGRAVLVGGQPYRIAQADGTVLADGNHPLAREALAFRVRLHEVVFPEAGGPPAAPGVLLADLDGAPFNLSALRGKPVLLDFYATWCVTCKQQAPILARAREQYGEDLTILSVTIDPTDTPDRVAAFREEVKRSTLLTWGRSLPADWTFAFDPTGAAGRGFSVVGIPREVLLDGEGRIRGTSVGLHPWEELRKDLDPLLAEARNEAIQENV